MNDEYALRRIKDGWFMSISFGNHGERIIYTMRPAITYPSLEDLRSELERSWAGRFAKSGMKPEEEIVRLQDGAVVETLPVIS